MPRKTKDEIRDEDVAANNNIHKWVNTTASAGTPESAAAGTPEVAAAELAEVQLPQIDLDTYECTCANCHRYWHRQKRSLNIHCEKNGAIAKHLVEYHNLCQPAPMVARVLVGPDQVSIYCALLPLSYYSTYFDRIIFRTREGFINDQIVMQAEDPRLVQIFVDWVCTGEAPSWKRSTQQYVEPMSLWILGASIGAPKFQNAIMHRIFNEYDAGEPLLASVADKTYLSTTPESKLRLFLYDLIQSDGPLSTVEDEASNHRPIVGNTMTRLEWLEFLDKRGRLVEEHEDLQIGFVSFQPIKARKPYFHLNHPWYLVEEPLDA